MYHLDNRHLLSKLDVMLSNVITYFMLSSFNLIKYLKMTYEADSKYKTKTNKTVHKREERERERERHEN